MPAVRARLFGWSPAGNNDEDVNVPHHLHDIPAIPFDLSKTNDLGDSPNATPSSPDYFPALIPSIPSLEPTSHTPSTDDIQKPVQRGDPAWVARPRNKFIIFRCQYSREHAKEHIKGGRANGIPAEKTLSKRASEAWSRLSPEEKDHFKELADRESEEHARRNPNYRFRPIKRHTEKRRKPRRCSHVPSFGRLRRKASKLSTVQSCEEEISAPPSYHESPPASPQVSNEGPPAKVVRRRRSSSLPLPYNPPSQYSAFLPCPEPRRPEFKRSRSVAGRLSPTAHHQNELLYPSGGFSQTGTSWDPGATSTSLPGHPYQASFEGYAFSQNNSQPPSSVASQSNSPSLSVLQQEVPGVIPSDYTQLPNVYDDLPAHYMSPLTAVASSLTGWNGDLTVPSEPQPSALWTSTPSVNREVVAENMLPGIPAVEERFDGLSPDYYESVQWKSTLLDCPYPLLANPAERVDISSGGEMKLSSYEDLERTQALQEYGIGLNDRLAAEPIASQTYEGVDVGQLFELDISELFPGL